MKKRLTQRDAKQQVLDYIRATGRKGVVNFMKEARDHLGREMFSERTLEKWLKDQERQLQDQNWRLLVEFMSSERFKSVLPYSRIAGKDERLLEVGDGLVALYGINKTVDGVIQFPGLVLEQGKQAIKLLEGYWKNFPSESDRSALHILSKIETIEEKRYAKIAYLAISRKTQISTTGLILYLNSQDLPEYEYFHCFLMQLWRRKDPETASLITSRLTFFKHASKKPKLAISNKINRYFYKEEKNQSNEELSESDDVSTLTQTKSAEPMAVEIVDFMLKDVLPHGFA